MVPPHLPDHDAFLAWFRAADLPEKFRFCYVRDRLWIDPAAESAFAHNRPKTAVAAGIGRVVRAGKLGVFFGDGMVFTSKAAEFTTVPDGIFVSHESERAGRIWLEGAKIGEADTKLVGVPDLVLEVVSNSSDVKDLEWLMSAYHNAGVAEYWVIDARGAESRFTIHRRGETEYAAVKPARGWQKSPALGKAFRLTETDGAFGRRDYELQSR